MPKGKYWYRQDSQGADAVLRRIVPDQRILRALGRLVADVVSAATIASPRSWELTLRERDLFLNVGQVAVLTVDRSRIFLCTVPIARRPTGLSYSSSKRRPAYDAVPVASARLHLPHERLLSLESSIVAALREFVREAAIAKTGSPWKYAHSPAAVDVLATVSGRRIEQPGYWNGGKEPDDNEPISPATLLDELAASQIVEQAAITFVSSQYSDAGWKVVSKESDKIGYDLQCTRGTEVRHLEVKGRARTGDMVILTNGEWQRAGRDSKWRLAIVSNAGSGRDTVDEWAGKSLQSAFRVDPIAFRLNRRSRKGDSA